MHTIKRWRKAKRMRLSTVRRGIPKKPHIRTSKYGKKFRAGRGSPKPKTTTTTTNIFGVGAEFGFEGPKPIGKVKVDFSRKKETKE